MKKKEKDIIWTPRITTVYDPNCPKCKKVMLIIDRGYWAYSCDCGDWYWIDKKQHYEIIKKPA